MPTFNKTKVIATIGPASSSKETITELINAGVNVFRVNFSHGDHAAHEEVIKTIHKVNGELNTHVSILADLQGPKIRLGILPNEGIMLEDNAVICLTTKDCTPSKTLIPVTYQALAMDITAGERILIDDGNIELKCLATNGVDEVKAQVIYGGIVRSKKGLNLPETDVSSPALTSKDIKDLEFILQHKINWIALSFVRTPEEIMRLKGIINYKQHAAKVIAKIEKPQAYKNIDEIINVSDAIMVARGDLGVEVPLQHVPVIQKVIVQKCIRAAKPVVIATQMMESMIKNASPTRAEVSDVATAIYDGADAIMLSGETAVGKYPVKVVETMKKVIENIEEQEEIYHLGLTPDPDSDTFLSDAVCFNACKIAGEVNAKGLIGMTLSGYTAFLLSSCRPKANIYIFTESVDLLYTVGLIWGVRAFLYTKFESTDNTMRDVQQILIDKGLIKSGDIVLNTGSMPIHERGRTNTIKVTKI